MRTCLSVSLFIWAYRCWDDQMVWPSRKLAKCFPGRRQFIDHVVDGRLSQRCLNSWTSIAQLRDVSEDITRRGNDAENYTDVLRDHCEADRFVSQTSDKQQPATYDHNEDERPPSTATLAASHPPLWYVTVARYFQQ